MSFHITKHFFNPHAASISLQSHLSVRQIGCQAPGLFLADLPVSQQVDRIGVFFCQPSLAQPGTGTCFLNPTAKIIPFNLMRQTNVRRGFLPQNIVPVSLIQLLKYRYRPKFGISYQQNSHSSRQKTVDIGQQGQLGAGGAVSANMRYPTPGNRDRTLPISQTDHQQLMRKSYFCSIHNQTHLLKRMGLLFKPASRNGLISRPHVYRRIVQKTAQPTGTAQQLHFTWYLACDTAQVRRTASCRFQSGATQSFTLV